MPIEFPAIGADGQPTNVAYYTTEESAKRLHITEKTLRAKLKTGQWPHLSIAGRYYLNDQHLGRIVEMLTIDPDDVSRLWRDATDRRVLGIVADDDEAEGGVS